MNPVARPARKAKLEGLAPGHKLPQTAAPSSAVAAQSIGKAPSASVAASGGSSPRSWQGIRRMERWLIARVLRALGDPALSVVLPGGDEVRTSAEPPVVTIRFHDHRTLWQVVWDPRMQFGDAYVDGRVSVEGELVNMLMAMDSAMVRTGRIDSGAKRAFRWLRLPRRNDSVRSRQNVYHHYDIGNDFYRLWLDQQLLYTCAYFAEPALTLEQAQIAKMDHVCRKVWLRPGDTVIEAGCGWGALALHMARHYGVNVRAYNASREQVAYARQRAADEGLTSQVEFVEDDWRNISGQCDAFVSVGMLEHVGLTNYRTLGQVVRRCLKPQGRGLIHSIGRNRPQEMDPWIERRIFPGAFPPALSQFMRVFETSGLSVLDVENLRRHYALTLLHWITRFENNVDEVRRQFDERFVRMWRMYLSGSRAAFECGALQLFQVVFAPDGNHRVPATRRHQYQDLAEPAWFPPQATSGGASASS